MGRGKIAGAKVGAHGNCTAEKSNNGRVSAVPLAAPQGQAG